MPKPMALTVKVSFLVCSKQGHTSDGRKTFVVTRGLPLEDFWDPVWVALVGGSLFINSYPFVSRVAGAGQVPKELFGRLSGGTSSSRSHLPVECTGRPKSPTSSAPLSGTAIELSDPF